MRRWLKRCSLLILGISALVGFLLIPVHPFTTNSGAAVVPTAIFDIDTPIVPGSGWAIPPNCSNWHELWPNWCTPHHQYSYKDNDHDGLVSVCDNIVTNNGYECWHITKVTATYFFSPVTGGGQHAAEPTVPGSGQSPVCDDWHIIFADGPPFTYCQTVHIEGWEDTNGSGTLDVCDNIQIGGLWYHIDRIGCDVTVTWNPVTQTRPGTWGWLKGLFRR